VSYANSPLPTTEDKMVFILTYVRQNVTQATLGCMFQMSQSNVSTWANVLHTVLNQALGAQNLLPARDAATLAQRLRDASPSADDSPFLSMMA